ncbi:MAG: twin-arginine translocation signal domain-containing protein [Burkholderiaceae bacterium]
MNRRHFLKALVAVSAAAGLPAVLLPVEPIARAAAIPPFPWIGLTLEFDGPIELTTGAVIERCILTFRNLRADDSAILVTGRDCSLRDSLISIKNRQEWHGSAIEIQHLWSRVRRR